MVQGSFYALQGYGCEDWNERVESSGIDSGRGSRACRVAEMEEAVQIFLLKGCFDGVGAFCAFVHFVLESQMVVKL